MPLQKQIAPLNFIGGVDQKTDPFQLDFGKFQSLVNMVYTTGKRLTKRNGYGNLAALPYASTFMTTFNGDLTAVGCPQLQAYSSQAQDWTHVGNIYPCNISTLPIVRNSLNQTQSDSAIAPNGTLCVAYTQQNSQSLSENQFLYAVYDSSTGQQLLTPQVLQNISNSYSTPRVFILGAYFVIVYIAFPSSVYTLTAIPVSISSLQAVAPIVVSTSVDPDGPVSWDGGVLNETLFLAWNGASSSGLKMASLSQTLQLSSTHNPDPSNTAALVAVSADPAHNQVWVTYYDGSSNAYTLAVNSIFSLTISPVQTISGQSVANITQIPDGSGFLYLFYEIENAYSYDSGVPTNYIVRATVKSSGPTGVRTVVRGVGLASRAFAGNYFSSAVGQAYFLVAYQSPYQPTYYLFDGFSTKVVAQLAYSNGGGYITNSTLPSVSLSGSTASVSYLYKDLVQALNDANSAGTVVTGGIYSQTGINQATLTLGTAASIVASEIGSNLNITGGFTWGYDGTQATEQGFFLWPDSVESTAQATTGGFITAQTYYYQVIRSWTDNKGNAFRSAGSIPIQVVVASGSTNTVTLHGPMDRLTYKTNEKIEIYRWSTGQQSFYEVTSITSPLLNSTSVDSWTFVDTLADSSIVGNALLYTTGGVVEDIGGPSFVSTFTFDDRLWGIDSEDTNLLWFSKQIIEGTPVELSDLLTMYVAPSLGAQGPTGALACGSAMDDKLILFKPTALYYINGTGPDNTGSNSQYSQPTFITSMIGCSNQASIVFQPQGLMFEFASEGGNQIWLLGRDLSTQYIGADVERLTLGASVTSAVSVPGSTFVKFTLSSGVTLMYDYFYQRWATHSTNATSSTIYQGLHTYVDQYNRVFQETPGLYLDGSNPVLQSFITSWINLTGLQGYQRAYWFYFLGQYISPHLVQIGIAYDYAPSPTQNLTIHPQNYSAIYGDGQAYGVDTPYGGAGSLEQWKIFLTQQRCQAFQIQFQEIYDPSFGIAPGAGLTISGLNLVFGQKKGYVPLPFSQGAS